MEGAAETKVESVRMMLQLDAAVRRTESAMEDFDLGEDSVSQALICAKACGR